MSVTSLHNGRGLKSLAENDFSTLNTKVSTWSCSWLDDIIVWVYKKNLLTIYIILFFILIWKEFVSHILFLINWFNIYVFYMYMAFLSKSVYEKNKYCSNIANTIEYPITSLTQFMWHLYIIFQSQPI